MGKLYHYRSFRSFGGRAAATWDRRWSYQDAPLGALINQPGQIGENRVGGEVLDGHRAVQGDCQPQGGQRRAA